LPDDDGVAVLEPPVRRQKLMPANDQGVVNRKPQLVEQLQCGIELGIFDGLVLWFKSNCYHGDLAYPVFAVMTNRNSVVVSLNMFMIDMSLESPAFFRR